MKNEGIICTHKKKKKESVTSPEWVLAIWVVRLSWSISIPVCRDNSASP